MLLLQAEISEIYNESEVEPELLEIVIITFLTGPAIVTFTVPSVEVFAILVVVVTFDVACVLLALLAYFSSQP